MKKFHFLVALAIVLLAAGCNNTSPTTTQNTSNNNSTQTNTQAAPVTQVSTDGWQTYSNADYGFTFNYPSDWKIVNEKKIDSQTLFVLDLASPEERAVDKFTVNLTITSGELFNNDLNNLVRATEQVYGKMDNTTIAGVAAKKITARSPGGTKKLSLKAAFVYNSLGYQIGSSGWVADENTAVAETNAILSTFKFTK